MSSGLYAVLFFSNRSMLAANASLAASDPSAAGAAARAHGIHDPRPGGAGTGATRARAAAAGGAAVGAGAVGAGLQAQPLVASAVMPVMPAMAGSKGSS